MAAINQVPVAPDAPERFRELLGDDYSRVEQAIRSAGEHLAGRVVWHVNSTARGGGVAEMLQSLLAYARGAGVDVRWTTIAGSDEFFKVTKRIHNHLHGAAGDGGELGDAERAIYEDALAGNAGELAGLVRPGDIVYLHDPQTAGLTRMIRSEGVRVVWRCHVGLDHPNELGRRAWAFLRPYVEDADAYVFSRRAFAWDGLEEAKLWLVAPSIDAFSAKNRQMEPAAVRAILARIGLGQDGAPAPVFLRSDGSRGRVDRAAEFDQDVPVPDDAPLVTQVSRWDRLKDPAGVLRSFTERCQHPDAHLLLARAVGRGGRRRSRGRRGAGRDPGAARGVARRAEGTRPPRLPADGRRGGERGDGERGPAPGRRGRPEEPRRGVRPDRRRGDVEGAPGGRQPHRRDPGPDRGRRVGAADRRPLRPRGRPRRRSMGCSAIRHGRARWARPLASGCASRSWVRATSFSTWS